MKRSTIFLTAALFLSLNVYAQSGWDLDTVKIGGIGQVIARKGIKDGPSILFLHGGPGSSRMKKADTWLPAWSSAMERNLLVTLPKIECPVYFFLGGKDYQTNCDIAKSYYKQLSGPKKEMYWFDKASHDVLVSDAAKVQHIIINGILAK